MSLINTHIDALNSKIRAAVAVAIADFYQQPVGYVKIETVNTTAEKTNPPGEHLNIQVGAQVVFMTEEDKLKARLKADAEIKFEGGSDEKAPTK